MRRTLESLSALGLRRYGSRKASMIRVAPHGGPPHLLLRIGVRRRYQARPWPAHAPSVLHIIRVLLQQGLEAEMVAERVPDGVDFEDVDRQPGGGGKHLFKEVDGEVRLPKWA